MRRRPPPRRGPDGHAGRAAGPGAGGRVVAERPHDGDGRGRQDQDEQEDGDGDEPATTATAATAAAPCVRPVRPAGWTTPAAVRRRPERSRSGTGSPRRRRHRRPRLCGTWCTAWDLRASSLRQGYTRGSGRRATGSFLAAGLAVSYRYYTAGVTPAARFARIVRNPSLYPGVAEALGPRFAWHTHAASPRSSQALCLSAWAPLARAGGSARRDRPAAGGVAARVRAGRRRLRAEREQRARRRAGRVRTARPQPRTPLAPQGGGSGASRWRSPTPTSSRRGAGARAPSTSCSRPPTPSSASSPSSCATPRPDSAAAGSSPGRAVASTGRAPIAPAAHGLRAGWPCGTAAERLAGTGRWRAACSGPRHSCPGRAHPGAARCIATASWRARCCTRPGRRA